MPNYRKILPVAEYIAVSASVVGTVATIATQQAAYAIAPLSLSALLNVTNRRQTEQRIEQQLHQTVTSVSQVNQRLEDVLQQDEQLQNDWQTLRQAVEQIRSEEAESALRLSSLETTLNQQITGFGTDIQGLQTRLANAEQQLTTALSELALKADAEQLADDFRQMQLALDAVATQLQTKVEAQAFQEFDQGIHQTIATLRTNVRTNLEILRTQLEPLDQLELGNVLSQSEVRLSQLETTAIELGQVQPQLEAQLSQLEQQLTAQWQADRQSQEAIANQRQSDLQAEITDQSTRVTAEIRGATNDLRTTIEQLESRTEQLRQQLELLLQTQPSAQPDAEATLQPTDPIPQLPTGEDFDLELNLGIDFGTGFTKVCCRDIAQENAEIVTFVEAEFDPQADTLNQTLIPTKIAILADGRLLTGLTTSEWETGNYNISQSIDFIKMRLAALDFPPDSSWRLEHLPLLDDVNTVESLCAYYLSQVIDRAQQWMEQTHPDRFVNQSVRWSVNVGVPVEYCDSPALARFQRVLNLAWVLKHTPVDLQTLTLETLIQLTAHLQQWMDENAIANLDCQTTPEIAAAVWSFLSSREAQNGFYTFFDVGDGTLDGAAFWFERKSDGRLIVDFYQGQVEPLGVTAFSQQAAAELKTPASKIRQWLRDNSDPTLGEQLHRSSIRRTIQKLVGSIVMKGKNKHESSINAHATDALKQNLRVFVGGGGGTTLFFRQAIADTHSDFKQDNAGVPAYQIKNISSPNNLTVNGIDPEDFNRFAVAYGLCIPQWEGPTIRLPSQVPPNDAASTQVFGTPPPQHGK